MFLDRICAQIISGEQVEDYTQDIESTKDDSYRTVLIQQWHECCRDKVQGHYQVSAWTSPKACCTVLRVEGMPALWIITHGTGSQGKDNHWELMCPREWLKSHPLGDYGKALAPMTGLVPLGRNFVNCHAKTTWQLELCLLKITRPTTSLHAGTGSRLEETLPFAY